MLRVVLTGAEFAVNSSALPDVNFNIRESYPGTLTITSNMSDPNQQWFGSFPLPVHLPRKKSQSG
jgi:carboxypeptidase D